MYSGLACFGVNGKVFMITPIIPVSAFPNQATHLCVSDGHVTLGEGANFQYVLLDISGNLVSQPARKSLTASQYNGWVGDDAYVCTGIANNLGLTPTGIPY